MISGMRVQGQGALSGAANMGNRLMVAVLAAALAFGALASVGLGSAGAYGSPTPGYIEAIAGNGLGGYSGAGGPALSAGLGVGALRVDPSNGNVVFVDNETSTVRVIPKVSGTYYGVPMTADDIYTIAGNGTAGYTGDFGPGPAAQLAHPWGLAIVPSGPFAGTVLIADSGNNVIRSVPSTSGVFFGYPYTAGDIYTLIGDGTAGYVDGLNTSAEFNDPIGVAIDNFGNVVVSDAVNNYLRVFAGSTGTFYGQSMTALNVYTIAGSDPCALGCSHFPSVLGNGGPALSATLAAPAGVVVAPNGNIVFADSGDSMIRVVAEASGTYFGVAMTPGNIYAIAGSTFSAALGDGGPATVAGLQNPWDIAFDGNGNLVIADVLHFRYRVVAATTGSFYGQSMTANDIYTIAGNGNFGVGGNGGPAVDAEFSYPSGVAVDLAGNVLTSDESGTIRAIAPLTCASSGSSPDPSQLTVSSSVDLATVTPNAQSRWTATVHNSGTESESCVVVTFALSSGVSEVVLGSIAKASPAACTYVRSGGTTGPVIEADCTVGTIAPGDDVTIPVFVQATGVKAGDQIVGSVSTTSNFTGGDSQPLPTISIVAPTPGAVQSDVAPGSSAVTDKGQPGVGANAGVTIVAKMKLPKYVTPGSDVPPGASPRPFAKAPLVTSTGALVTMVRQPASAETGPGQLCDPNQPDGACKGDIITLDPFVNYYDPLHPAVLTLSWAASSVNGVIGHLYKTTPAHPEGVLVPACGKKLATGYAVLPCYSKAVINQKIGTKNYGILTIAVQILSGDDPGFARR
jgi:hypothetical protein